MGRREGAYTHTVSGKRHKKLLWTYTSSPLLGLSRIITVRGCPATARRTVSRTSPTGALKMGPSRSVLARQNPATGATGVGADQSVGGLKPWTEAVKQVDKYRNPCKRETRRESPTVPAGAASAWLGVHGLSNVARSRSTVLGGISHEQHRHMAKPTVPATKTRFVMKGAVAMRGCVVPLHARSADDS